MTDLKGFDALAKEIEAHREEALERLNRDLFRDGAGYRPIVPPWSRRVRMRVRDYLSTLWRALKGDDPYDDEGW